MHSPYVYHGDGRIYEFGHAEEGSIAYFAGRPPDGNWTAYVPPVVELTEESRDESAGDLKQPNKAAAADDWRAFADKHGGFQEQTGKSPMDPATTRKEIVDHYTGDTNDAEVQS